MDIRQLPLEDNSFDVVLDKGTLDALEVDKSEETLVDLRKTLSEVYRVLKVTLTLHLTPSLYSLRHTHTPLSLVASTCRFWYTVCVCRSVMFS